MKRFLFNKDRTSIIQSCQRIAGSILLASGIFILIVAVLMTANFLVARRSDPVESVSYQALLERIEREPENNELRVLARDLDLMARKAYFANISFNRTGGRLLLIGALIFLLAFQLRMMLRWQLPAEKRYQEGDGNGKKKATQRWAVAAMVFLIAVFGLALSFSGPIIVQQSTLASIQEAQTKQTGTPQIPIGTSTQTDNGRLTGAAENGDSQEIVADDKSEGLSSEQAENGGVKQGEQAKQEEKLPPPTFELFTRNWPGLRGAFGRATAFKGDYPVQWDGPSGAGILWKARVPKLGFSSPVVWGEKVFLTGGDDGGREIYCFDVSSGKLLWQRTTKGIAGLATKVPKVSDDTGYAASTGVTDGRYFVAIFATGDLICVNMEGEVIWTRSLGVPANRYGHSSSLITDGDLLFVQFDHELSASIYALDIHTGENVWKTNRQVGPGWSSPILIKDGGGRKELILTGNPSVDSYDPTTGKQLWSVECLSGEVAPSAAFGGGLIFAANEYASICAISAKTKEIVWRDEGMLPDVSSPLVVGDYLIVPTSWGLVTCYRAQTGEILWQQEFDYGFYASPIQVGDRVYLMDRNGDMRIFRADSSFELLASPALGEAVVSTPAFVDGKIFVRSNKTLYCIGGKQ